MTVAVFAVGIAIWCAAGSWLGGHRRVIAAVRGYGHRIVPVVLIAIGVTTVA